MTRAERIAHHDEQRAMREAVELERLMTSLRGACMLQPGATEADFEKALLRLIADYH